MLGIGMSAAHDGVAGGLGRSGKGDTGHGGDGAGGDAGLRVDVLHSGLQFGAFFVEAIEEALVIIAGQRADFPLEYAFTWDDIAGGAAVDEASVDGGVRWGEALVA